MIKIGIFDTVTFEKYCDKEKKRTTWECQFKWEHSFQNWWKIGEKMWLHKIQFVWEKKPMGYSKEVMEDIKATSLNARGYVHCQSCAKIFNDKYWEFKRAHADSPNNKCPIERIVDKTDIEFKWHPRTKKMEKIVTKLPKEKWSVFYAGICQCGYVQRKMNKHKLRYWFYDCRVKIRNGIIIGVDNFKKDRLESVSG